MRCPDCNKFVSFNTDEEPEEQDEPDVTDDRIAASYRRVLTCGDCGTELKEATIEFDEEIDCSLPCKSTEPEPEPAPKNGKTEEPKEPEHEWEVVSSSASASERSQTTDRNGRVIKLSRYRKTFYGVSLEVELKCAKCGTEHSETFENEEQASGFEELT